MSEFSRPLRVDIVGAEPRDVAIEAAAGEREALARRFDLASLDRLSAEAAVQVQGGDIRARGRLSAGLVQLCVATNAEMPAEIDVPFDIIFRNQPPADVPDAGLELSEGECDVVFYDGAAIDLGEAVAETLALSIDPYPRCEGADEVLKASGVLGEGEAGPFTALAALKK